MHIAAFQIAFAASAGRATLVMLFLMTSTKFCIEGPIKKKEEYICSGLYMKLHVNSSPRSSFRFHPKSAGTTVLSVSKYIFHFILMLTEATPYNFRIL